MSCQSHVSLLTSLNERNFAFRSTMTRKEAESRLSHLSPESAEYNQLQLALIKTNGIVEIILPTTTYRINTMPDDCRLHGGFGVAENMDSVKSMQLQGLENDHPILIIRGKTNLLFRHIIALAGDFYTWYYPIIGEGLSDEDKIKRFSHAFEQLLKADESKLDKIVSTIEKHYKTLMEELSKSIKNSEFDYHYFSNHLLGKHSEIEDMREQIGAKLLKRRDFY